VSLARSHRRDHAHAPDGHRHVAQRRRVAHLDARVERVHVDHRAHAAHVARALELGLSRCGVAGLDLAEDLAAERPRVTAADGLRSS
jgi:hypothetical protein